MQPRPHPLAFAKRLLPNLAFSQPDKMFFELRGPKREAFLMFLWNQAGEGIEQVAPVSVGRKPGEAFDSVLKLEVVGVVDRGGYEIAVLSMPPAVAPNEPTFVALVRGQGRTQVFYLERCLDASGALSPTDVAFAAVTPEGRSNYGFFPDAGLSTFKERLGAVLGVSLEGLETSLPPITMAAFMGAGAAPAGANASPAWQGARKVAAILMPLAAARAGASAVLRVVPLRIPGITTILMVLSLAVSIVLLVWLYRVFDALRGRTRYSPGLAVGGWFIPFANLVLPPLVMRDAYKTATGQDGTPIVALWWLAWLGTTIMTAAGPAIHQAVSTGSRAADAPVVAALSWGTTLFVIANYGLLWLIVKKVDG